MISQYQQTQQGQQTRSLIIAYLQDYPEQEFSRDDLVRQCSLTYDQVRRQTKTLCVEGVIKSRISTNGRRIYQLRSSFIQKIGISAMVILLGWAIKVEPNSNNTVWHHAFIPSETLDQRPGYPGTGNVFN